MAAVRPTCLGELAFDSAADLAKRHPPALQHENKRAAFDLGLPLLSGRPVRYSRWQLEELPSLADPAGTQVLALPGVFEYPFQQPGQALWHVNFADTQLFFAYGSSLFAQDEVQVAEHPVLASVREAALASRRRATRPLTREPGAPTPILVSGADRCLSIDTARLYGHAFAAAPAATVRRCCRQLRPPTVSNILAMAAPQGAGAYSCVDLADILQTATCGFAAAAQASEGRTLVCTGHWGCGAFGGSRVAMALLQIAAARLAGVHELRYHAFDEAGAAAVHEADTLLGKIWQPGLPGAALVQRVQALGFQWGESDGT